MPVVGLALLPPIAGLPLLLMPLHLVWLELVVHPVSALLFQGDPAPPDLMQRPPRDPRAPMLARGAVLRSAVSGGLLTLAVLALFAWKAPAGADHARGLALAALTVGYQLLVLFERAASGHTPRALLPRSIRFWAIWGAAAVSLPVLMYIPGAAALFNLGPLSAADWLLATGAAVLAVGWRLAV